MNTKSILSARNPITASGYAAMAYLTTSAAFAAVTPPVASEDGGGLGVVTTFLDNIATILNAASLVVVTIAIVFAGYQIAFNNKRISDVAPVLLGGVLIGGAGAIAGMLLAGGEVGMAGG